MRRLLRIAAALLVLSSLALAAAAAAAQEQPVLGSTVTAVDASGDEVEVAILSTDYSVSASDVVVSEAGAEADASVATALELGRATEVIYVLDVDNRILANGVWDSAVSAIGDAVADLPASVRIGLVTAGERATLQTRLTTDRQRLAEDLDATTAEQGSALVDAIGLAADAFSDRSGVVRSVVVVAAGSDTASESTVAAAETELIQKGAQLVVASYGGIDAGLDGIVSRTAGTTVVDEAVETDREDGAEGSAVGSTFDIEGMVQAATTVAADRLLVSYQGTSAVGDRPNVTIELAGETLRFSYPVGTQTSSNLQLTPTSEAASQDLGFFGQPVVLYISIALAFAAISTALWSLGSMFAGGETSLDKVLARYSDRDETLEDADVQEMLVQTALIKRAVDMTETFAEQRGFLSRIEDLLERANLPVRAGEALFFLSAIVVVVLGLAIGTSGSIFVGLIAAVVTAVGGYFTVQFMAKRRLKQFEAQLPDALQLLAGTMRAGYSLPQGLDAVSVEIADPMGQELRRAITEAQLGRELDDALAGIAERLDSPDFAWAVMAIGIQREVGGNLAELLITVAETMIQRERLRREVNALTAEGRVSAGILSMLPPGLGFVMWIMNPDYVGVLFSRTIGLVLIGVAVVAGLIGLAWMKKVITIDA